MQLGKTMGWLVRNSASQSRSPGYDDFIDRLLGGSYDNDSPGAENTIDAEDDVSSVIIASALFALGILSLFNLFGNSLLYPYGTFFPHWPEAMRFLVYGLAVGSTMIGFCALAILMAGRAPIFSLALSVVITVATGQFLAAFTQMMEPPVGVNAFSGFVSLTIAGILFVWYYLEDKPRRLLPLVCGLVMLIGMLLTENLGILEYLAHNLIGLVTIKFDPGWLFYALVLSCIWLFVILLGGGAAHSFATVASPRINPLKTSALFLSIFNMLIWVLWIDLIVTTLTRKRNKSG